MEQLPTQSPEENEDLQTLIPQNSRPSHFHLGYFYNNKKRYLFMVFLPLLLLLIVYFSVHFLRSSSVWDVNFAAPSPEIRTDSELRALYLLRQQQLGLLNLLNTPNYTLLGAAAVHNTQANIIRQISINDQVQKLLLSPTHNPNTGNIVNTSSTLTLGGVHLCNKKYAGVSERRTIEWIPRSDRYLFAICASGQMSNHLICLEKHMFFAAVLKRILVIPSHRVDYRYSRVLDIQHINQCLERKVVVTFEEFTKERKETRINKFICYFPYCYMDEEHVRKLKSLGLSLPKLESPWRDDVRKPKKRTILDLQAKFSCDDKVIAIGDVFFADVERDWVMQPGGPIAHKCKTLVEPSRLILLTAQRFVQTFLGSHYVALHFRRHGFLKFCNMKTPSCFFPVPQAANCIQHVVERSNAQVIYLSTDAAESEIGLLQSLIAIDGKHVPLVKRPPRSSAEKWDSLLYRHGLHDDSQVEAMLDKTISAMSSVFIGSSGSTFTEDILRLRKDWGSASSCDEYICQGELPNFIADNE